MCGIVAGVEFVGLDGQSPHPDPWVHNCLTQITHRGPEGHGVRVWDDSGVRCSLGMTRLRLVDQSDLYLPLHYPDLNIALAYNGEIYNCDELRTRLPPRSWDSWCDGEVLAAAWREWGPRCLPRLNGMWAFALFDFLEGALHLVRDRAGEKPLYYAEASAGVYAASEIKALPIPLIPTACPDVGALEFDFRADTPFRHVCAVQPGEHIAYSYRGGELHARRHTWWQLPTEDVMTEPEVMQAEDQLCELLTDAVRLRATSERPVGVQLSGGLDSAIIQAICQSDRLYCITFPETDFDVIVDAQRAAGGHTEVEGVSFTPTELLDDLDTIAWHLDTPATWSATCLWFLYHRMHQDGVIVTLSGEGADELFGGYARYRLVQGVQDILDDPWLTGYDYLKQRVLPDPAELMTQLLCRHAGIEHRRHTGRLVQALRPTGRSLVPTLSHIEFYSTMQVLLRMADRMAGAVGMENRSPFLDYRVMEFAARLPARLKTGIGTKDLLRSVARRLGVSLEITDAKHKRGLALPWPEWSKRLTPSRAGSWDRSGFTEMMREAWLRTCRRESHLF